MAIGLERQLTGHKAGIRINVLICMGSCLFLMFPMMYQTDEVYRIASYIVSGVGFLCSGVIFKEHGQVNGINTAATLWCTAAIGILSSTGKWQFALSATLILIISNLFLRPIAIKITPLTENEENERFYRISVTCAESEEIEVRTMLLNSNTSKNVFLNNIDAVYSSQYVRAISTAKYIAENNNLDIIIDERLGERVIGTEEKPKDFWIEQMLNLDSKTTDGESQREVRNRMLSFMDDILKNDFGKNVVVVSHATAMTFLLMKWCKLENVVLEGKKRKLVFNGKVVIDDSFNN